MKIKGLIENSFLDWDGKISTIVFTGGCNFRCPFCHNKELVLDSGKMADISEDYIFNYIVTHKKWIDGVVVTGGEPLLQPDILEFLQKIKNAGFLVKLDTNGYLPELLKKAVNQGLVDYVAMDLKSGISVDRYSAATGTKIDIEKIKQSINFLLENHVEYEFRTTIVPTLVTLEDLQDIAKNIKPESKWAWQNFRKTETLVDPALLMFPEYVKKDLDEFENNLNRKIIRR